MNQLQQIRKRQEEIKNSSLLKDLIKGSKNYAAIDYLLEQIEKYKRLVKAMDVIDPNMDIDDNVRHFRKEIDEESTHEIVGGKTLAILEGIDEQD